MDKSPKNRDRRDSPAKPVPAGSKQGAGIQIFQEAIQKTGSDFFSINQVTGPRQTCLPARLDPAKRVGRQACISPRTKLPVSTGQALIEVH